MSVRTIHGTFPWEISEIPNSLPDVPSRALDQGILNTWIDSAVNRPERAIRNLLGRNIVHIDNETFNHNLIGYTGTPGLQS